MDNRGFPSGAPLGEGKAGFAYQAMNGSYPGMCYTGQEMVMPYGQYGTGTDVPFNEQCAVPQQMPQAPANMPYGFGSQAHQYMHYRQQAHIMQAAYNNVQHQNRVTNPQQIADSIYNMAAHAYSYQQQQNPQLQQAPNSYSPGGNQRSTLSVRTGQSPANSLHSPAGSTHSMGERPLLSPHVQSNAQIYNYHHSTHQANNRLTPSQQQHVPAMGYYSNNNGHTPTAVNGCMNAELDQRQSIERLAAISHLSEQFTHNQDVGSPVHSTNKVPTTQYYQPSVSVAGAMAAPVGACQHKTDISNISRPPLPAAENNLTAEMVASSSISNQPSLQSKPTTVSSPGENRTMSSTLSSNVKLAPDRTPLVSTAVTKELDSVEDDMKPKETAVDSGIDSEQIDKDNDEEHDTSTTSNKSEASPHPPKMATDTRRNTNLLVTTDSKVHDSEPHSDSDVSRVDSRDRSILSPAETGYQSIISPSEGISQSNISPKDNRHASPSPPPKDGLPPQSPLAQNLQLKTSETEAIPTVEDDRIAHGDGSVKLPSKESDDKSEDTCERETLDTSMQQSDLNESFSSQVSNSFSSSGASKQSMGDESRLPPRKRKQQLSEHTNSLKAAMPIKKRGRPSKEAVRLREAARLAEYQRAAELTMQKEVASAIGPQPVKERKSSISSMSKVKKPVHSGTLLHSPKLNLTTREEPPQGDPLLSQPTEKVDSDVLKLAIHKPNVQLPLKSNAVLVSPPRKPKASVNEMEKALMSVVGNDLTNETHFIGKRGRGRPPGSKNRRTKIGEQRARSNSASSISKSQYNVNLTAFSPKEETSKNAEFTRTETTNAKSTGTSLQSHKLSLSVQNRAKSLQNRKYKSVSPKSVTSTLELKLPISTDLWVCTFCQHISNYRNMGDLFGGYNIQPQTPLPAKVTSHRKPSDLRQLPPDKNNRPNEIWFHERCIIWSPGVYMHGGKLYGVYEAVTAAFQTTCSSCKKKGAILGCFCKGCTQRYHLHCAEIAECVLNEENFSMLCTKHKDKKIVLM